MAALAAPRKNFSNKSKLIASLGLPVAATQVIYNGALVGWNTSGYIVPGATTAGIRIAGFADLGNKPSVDTTGKSNGDVVIDVKMGIFPMVNGTSTDACTQADVGNDVYVLDDQTISRLPGAGRPIAGQLVKFEGAVPYVAIGMRLPNYSNGGGAGTAYQGPGSSDTIAAAGAISVNTAVTAAAVTGTTAYTLADGLFLGQRKTIVVSSGASTPNATVTPATRGGGYANVSALGALGDSVEFIWANPSSPAWYIASSQGVTIA